VPRGLRRRFLAREDQIDAALDQRLGRGRHRVELAFGEADVERHVARILNPQLPEPDLEAFDGGMGRGPGGIEHADAERPPRGRLLGFGVSRRTPQENRRRDPEPHGARTPTTLKYINLRRAALTGRRARRATAPTLEWSGRSSSRP